MNVLITGHTRGLGAALADVHLAHGHRVYGLSRTQRSDAVTGLVEGKADFAAPETLSGALATLVPSTIDLACVYLNAGVLGPIAALRTTALDSIRDVMEINVWANKVILDWLLERRQAPAQIVLMSSGASVSGNFGWGAYALSKATLNMLAKLYAHEFPQSHLCALAPGLVATAMQDEIAAKDAAVFPSLARLQAARGTPAMPTPDIVARRIVAALPRLRGVPSGAFVDLREALP